MQIWGDGPLARTCALLRHASTRSIQYARLKPDTGFFPPPPPFPSPHPPPPFHPSAHFPILPPISFSISFFFDARHFLADMRGNKMALQRLSCHTWHTPLLVSRLTHRLFVLHDWGDGLLVHTFALLRYASTSSMQYVCLTPTLASSSPFLFLFPSSLSYLALSRRF